MMLNVVSEAVEMDMESTLCSDVQLKPNGFVSFACTRNSNNINRMDGHVYIYIYSLLIGT